MSPVSSSSVVDVQGRHTFNGHQSDRIDPVVLRTITRDHDSVCHRGRRRRGNQSRRVAGRRGDPGGGLREALPRAHGGGSTVSDVRHTFLSLPRHSARRARALESHRGPKPTYPLRATLRPRDMAREKRDFTKIRGSTDERMSACRFSEHRPAAACVVSRPRGVQPPRTRPSARRLGVGSSARATTIPRARSP